MKTTVYFEQDDDIIEICKDNVFKAVFTKDMPQARIALSKLVSALIGRDVVIEEILANELPVSSTYDRHVRFDINCRAENGELVNVEMCYYPNSFEPARLEFHAAKIFSAQNIKGSDKNFGDLMKVYQVAILDKKRFFGDDVFFHTFEYYDPVNKASLNGKTRIITLELSKLENVVKKTPEEMNPQEKWAFYFRYLTDKTKRGIINDILEREEGIAMASEVVKTISTSLEERLLLIREEMAELDYNTYRFCAKEEGREEGLEEGRKEGREEGRKEGREEGREEIVKEIIRMKEEGKTLDDIIANIKY